MAKFRQSWLVRLIFGSLARILALCTVLILAARMLPTRLSAFPYLPNLVSLTPWLILIDLVALILALFSSKWVTALILIAAMTLNVSWQHPFYSSKGVLSRQTMQTLSQGHVDRKDGAARLMTLNVYKGRADPQSIISAVREQRVEVLALQETDDDFISRLHEAGIQSLLPYEKVSSADGQYGNGIWTAAPMNSPARDDVGSRASMMPAGSVDFKDGASRVRFVSVHTTSPTPSTWTSWRDSLLDMESLKQHKQTRYVLMGDFNATYDHAVFRDLLGDRFQDSARQAGHGMTMTWPSNCSWLPRSVAIDHIVVDRGMEAGQMQTLTIPGSDHAALLATLQVD